MSLTTRCYHRRLLRETAVKPEQLPQERAASVRGQAALEARGHGSAAHRSSAPPGPGKQACAREMWTWTLEMLLNFYMSGNNPFSPAAFSAHGPYRGSEWASCGPLASSITLVLEHYPHWMPY